MWDRAGVGWKGGEVRISMMRVVKYLQGVWLTAVGCINRWRYLGWCDE